MIPQWGYGKASFQQSHRKFRTLVSRQIGYAADAIGLEIASRSLAYVGAANALERLVLAIQKGDVVKRLCRGQGRSLPLHGLQAPSPSRPEQRPSPVQLVCGWA